MGLLGCGALRARHAVSPPSILMIALEPVMHFEVGHASTPGMETRKLYPTDISDEEWPFAATYLTLMTPDAPQRESSLREVFNATRWIMNAGMPWCDEPGDYPRSEAVYEQTQRWFKAGPAAAIVHEVRDLLSVVQDRPLGPLGRRPRRPAPSRPRRGAARARTP